MAGLLAADVQPARPHVFGHVTVADLRPIQRQAAPAEEPFQPQIGHHGRHDTVAAQLARLLPGTADQPKHLIAVDDLAALIGHDQPVSIAVQRETEIGVVLGDQRTQMLRTVEPQPWLMLNPSGSTPVRTTVAPSSQRTVGATR